jgi:RNA polymerase sigma-70 factor, ECF subfamily
MVVAALAPGLTLPIWAFDAMSAPAFAQVYEAHAAFVWRSLRRLGVREADLEDVTQEVFVVVHRKLPEFDGRSSVKTWVFGICLRTASDYRRKAHVKREEIVDEVPDAAVEQSGPRRVEQRLARAMLDRLLDGLDEEKRATFVLFELEQLPMADVAAVTDVPLQTAYARLYAARRSIEAALQARKEAVA